MAHHEHKHDCMKIEPQYGLPESLPAGEKVLWQGSPKLSSIINKVFLFRILAVYFLFILGVSFYWDFQGAGLNAALTKFALHFLLSSVCLLALTLLAYLTCNTTVYTLTDKRIVMRIGIVLTLTFNIPFKQILASDYKIFSDGSGDISFLVEPSTKIAFVHLWPHCRFKSFAHPEPALRCIDKVADVAVLVHQAWTKDKGINQKNFIYSTEDEESQSKETISGNEAKAT